MTRTSKLASIAGLVDARAAESVAEGDPGMAVAVLHRGDVVHARGYGLADLTHGLPVTVDTPFHIASLSKHMTGFAVHLLAASGRLELDRDLREALPAMAGYPEAFTARQALHHTSGLRDFWSLLLAAGWRMDDAISQQDVLAVLARQRSCNSAPGESYTYSNSGYALLGELVSVTSGTSLREFSAEQLFGPLGMSRTDVVDVVGQVVPGSARSYRRAEEGWREAVMSLATTGGTGVRTTISDLVRWDANLTSGSIGGEAVLTAMHTVPRQSTVDHPPYASGLLVDRHRGRRRVHHAGGDAGFTAVLYRYPDDELSVAVLCNNAELSAPAFGHEIAGACLDRLGVPPEAETSRSGDAPSGSFVNTTSGLTFTFEKDRSSEPATTGTVVHGPFGSHRLQAAETGWVSGPIRVRVVGSDGASRLVVSSWGETALELVAARSAGRRRRPAAGSYWSSELETLYELSMDGRELVLTSRRQEVRLAPSPIGWSGHWPDPLYPVGVAVRCSRPTHGRGGVEMSFPRSRGIRFEAQAR